MRGRRKLRVNNRSVWEDALSGAVASRREIEWLIRIDSVGAEEAVVRAKCPGRLGREREAIARIETLADVGWREDEILDVDTGLLPRRIRCDRNRDFVLNISVG